MAKDKEEVTHIIPTHEFIPDLEREVNYHLSQIPKQIKNTIKYSRTEYPNFKGDIRAELSYQSEEFRRCIHGYNGMSPKMYFFYHYCFLRDPELGKIRPEYRKISADWFQFVDDHLKPTDKRGIVAIKRRRVGMSWMAAADLLHQAIFTPMSQIGMNSKSEADSRSLFKAVKFIYQNLPDWMRPRTTASDRRDYMEFAYPKKDSAGNRSKGGLESFILSVAPTTNSYEGGAFSRVTIDEGGRILNLLDMWAVTRDTLMKPPRMIGLPIIFGTVGETNGGSGTGIKEIWDQNEVYGFDRFFMGGYNALDGMIDEYGNDLVEHAVRWIIYERHRIKTSKKEFNAFIQKYPLNERDAFNCPTDGGVGNIILINDQITKLTYNPPEARTGWMRPKPDGTVDFVPNPNGKIIIYELPDSRRINGYVAGADPADHDDVKKTRDSSNLALAILAKPFGMGAPKLVLEYVDRPEKLDAFFEQSAMALKWYNNTKVLVEDNRARMINYFKIKYPALLPLVPKSIATARGGSEMKHSVKMTEDRKQQAMGLIEDNVDNYSEYIPSIRLLEEFKVFGDAHSDDDLAIAYALALMMLQADKKAASTVSDMEKIPKTTLQWINGHLTRTNHDKAMVIARKIPKHPLFG